MASFKDLEHKVNQFLENEKKPGEMSHLSSSHMDDVADEELSSNDGYLSTDHNNHTARMRSDYIRIIIDSYKSWSSKAKGLENDATDMRSNLSSSAAQKKIDSLVAEKEQSLNAIRESHDNGPLGELRKIKEETGSLYDSMRKANRGKPPRRLPFWYFIFLMVIGASEWMINYETFAAKFAVTVMAIGMTLLVALSFAAASHFHGEALKQRSAHFGSHVENTVKNTHRMFTLIASVLFLVCFSAVIMVRYQVIQDQFSLTPNFGGNLLPGQTSGPQQSYFELLLPTVFLNLAVYLLGLVISYAVHDTIPGYQTAKRDAEKANKNYEKEKINKLQKEIRQKESAFDVEIKDLVATLEQNQSEAKKLDQIIVKLKEANISFRSSCVKLTNNYIEQYRYALALSAKRKGYTNIKIGHKDLTFDQYLEENISIKEERLDEN